MTEIAAVGIIPCSEQSEPPSDAPVIRGPRGEVAYDPIVDVLYVRTDPSARWAMVTREMREDLGLT